MKRFLALFLLFAVLFAALTACSKQTGNQDQATTGDTPAGDTQAGDNTSAEDTHTDDGTFVPVLRFVALSDVHLTDTSDYRDVKFRKMFVDAYAYADAHANYNKLDGIFVVGDVANNGSTVSLARFFTALNTGARAGTVTRATLGNHEFVTDGANTVSRFLSASGYESEDAHLVIGGYHFIFLSPDAVDSNGNGGRGFTTAKQNWLSAELAAAAADEVRQEK